MKVNESFSGHANQTRPLRRRTSKSQYLFIRSHCFVDLTGTLLAIPVQRHPPYTRNSRIVWSFLRAIRVTRIFSFLLAPQPHNRSALLVSATTHQAGELIERRTELERAALKHERLRHHHKEKGSSFRRSLQFAHVNGQQQELAVRIKPRSSRWCCRTPCSGSKNRCES